MNAPFGKSTVGEMLPYFIVIGILILFCIFCIRMIITTSKARKQRKQSIQNMKNQGILIYTAFEHVNGLPIPEGLLCEIKSYQDRLDFKAGTTNIKLYRKKITDMCIKTDTEIQNQAVSSIGGTIAGGIMFGPLGAIIGGRAKTKKIKTTTKYLIITYTGEQGELKYIGFDIKNNPLSAIKLTKEFHELNQNSEVQIEL